MPLISHVYTLKISILYVLEVLEKRKHEMYLILCHLLGSISVVSILIHIRNCFDFNHLVLLS